MFSTVLALCFLLKIISRSNYFAPKYIQFSGKTDDNNIFEKNAVLITFAVGKLILLEFLCLFVRLCSFTVDICKYYSHHFAYWNFIKCLSSEHHVTN